MTSEPPPTWWWCGEAPGRPPHGEPARLVFLLLSPRDDVSAQLQIMGQIARLFQTPAARAVVYESDSVDVVRAMIKTAAGEAVHGEALPAG